MLAFKCARRFSTDIMSLKDGPGACDPPKNGLALGASSPLGAGTNGGRNEDPGKFDGVGAGDACCSGGF